MPFRLPKFRLPRPRGWAAIAVAALLVEVVLIAIYFPRKTDSPLPAGQLDSRVTRERAFYEAAYSPRGTSSQGIEKSYSAREEPAGEHVAPVQEFVRDYRVADKHVLDVGSGDGSLQDLVKDYTGLDISESARRFYHKPFAQGSATRLPFADNEFDVVWTVYTLEHVPNPEQALREMRRVVKNGGLIYLLAGWYVGSWKADGYEVRPYSDFGWTGKLVKASVPVRRRVYYRALYTFPIRLMRFSFVKTSDHPAAFRYNSLVPNYTHHWDAGDGDAVNDMDPYEAVLWFTSRGDICLNRSNLLDQYLFRNGPLVFKIQKQQ